MRARAIVGAGLLLPLILGAAGAAFASDKAQLNIGVVPSGIAAIKDATAQTGFTAGSINLSWTEPGRSGITLPTAYDIRVSSLNQISNNEEFALALPLSIFSTATIPAPGPGGGLAGFVLTGLEPGVTYYFAIRQMDSGLPSAKGSWRRIPAQNWNVNNFAAALPENLPATPTGLTVIAGINKALLSWSDLPAASKANFAFFRLYRSTQPSSNFVAIATTAALAYTDKPLTPLTTYYYRLSARDAFGLESLFTPVVSAQPFNLPPMEPIGLTVVASSNTVTFNWSAVTRFEEGTLFDSTGTPTSDELAGYQILRSTNICVPDFSALSSGAAASPPFTDTTGGNAYYYRIRSYNSAGLSTATLSISSLGEMNFFLDDCLSRMVLDTAQASALNAVNNGMGGDIMISRRSRPEDVGGAILKSVEFRPLLNGVMELDNFYLPRPARIVLRYATSGGAPVPAALRSENLGIYWDNGVEFKKMYGEINAADQTVLVESPNLGTYQIRSLLRSDGAVFDLSNLSSRVITPNGDGLNDILIFGYDSGPNNVTPAGKIYDLHGAVVGTMTPGLVPNTLTWDGRMNGRVVTSGVYYYQIRGDGKTFNGSIVIAR
ncbi:MAG: hypothetical protein A3J74_08670 [Elusimicrobia bacterium RIFCSPHIGHO2_02_FULL_57_9]|nr:MAG: hypothetical protein A3J74_08670 [Elusimicrobia bacterium RIFCSPHIGHO2_02_FULL_57_9]